MTKIVARKTRKFSVLEPKAPKWNTIPLNDFMEQMLPSEKSEMIKFMLILDFDDTINQMVGYYNEWY
jgi:hypothetical protein